MGMANTTANVDQTGCHTQDNEIRHLCPYAEGNIKSTQVRRGQKKDRSRRLAMQDEPMQGPTKKAKDK